LWWNFLDRYLFGEQKVALSFKCLWPLFSDRKLFWDKVASRGMLEHKNLIVAGDLNFTVSVGEVWGASTQLDQLAGYFKELFQDNRLVDVIPDVLVPTWQNGRSGDESILKRLDQVYMSEDLINGAGRFRSWVAYPYLSDHAPVIFAT
jgi:endonuclease/exonuclease/phosphatase family metal-dependent hydrolase